MKTESVWDTDESSRLKFFLHDLPKPWEKFNKLAKDYFRERVEVKRRKRA